MTPRFHVRLTLTEQEILNGLDRAQLRRASRGRLIVQSVVLLLVTAWCWIAFFAEGMQSAGSFAIGLIALLLIPIMLFVPRLQARSIAKSMVERGEFPCMWAFEEGLDFGDEQPADVYFKFGSFFCDRNEQSLVFRFVNDDVVVVPRRLLSDDDWAWLCEKTVGAADIKRRGR